MAINRPMDAMIIFGTSLVDFANVDYLVFILVLYTDSIPCNLKTKKHRTDNQQERFQSHRIKTNQETTLPDSGACSDMKLPFR